MTALGLLRALREDVANGNWSKGRFVSERSGHRCLIAGARHHIGWEEFSEPRPVSSQLPIHEYWMATDALARAIVRVFPRYHASDNEQTIMDFNDSDSIRRAVVLEILEAAILDVEDAVLAQA